jgi:ribosomal protein L3
MEKQNYLYTDMVGRIDYKGGMIRIVLVNNEGEVNDDDVFVPHTTIVMPLNNFLSFKTTADELCKKLIEGGIIKEKEKEE